MSQAMNTSAAQINVPPLVRSAPINPYGDRAKAIQEQIANELQAAPPPSPQAQPPVDLLAQADVSTPPAQPEVAQPEVTQPVPPVDYTIPAYNNDPALVARLQQMEQERAYLSKQIEAQNQTLADLTKSHNELERLRAQQQLYDNVDANAFADLSSVDTEDAQKISMSVLNATAKALAPMRDELEKQRHLIDQKLAQQNQQMEAARLQALQAKILAAHPDYYQLVQSKQYRDFMAQKDGLSSKTRDTRAAEEFLAGNTDYVIDMLNRVKGVSSKAAQMQAVPPVQVATSAGAAPDTPTVPVDQALRELNNQFSRRQISHDEYRRRLAALRAANKE